MRANWIKCMGSLSRHALPGMLIVWLAISIPSPVLAQQAGDEEQIERIRQIVLRRGDGPAALAHLVQLAKDLKPASAAELFVQLADDYARHGKFNLAGDTLQQLVEHYPEQRASTRGLIFLVRLYASSEIAHAQQAGSASADDRAFATYALYLAQQAFQKHRHWADEPALAFQCAVAARLSGKPRVARSWLTPIKHNPRSQPWHRCALVENWLQGARDDTPPKPTLVCSRVHQRPRLDAALDEPLWQRAPALQFAATEIRVAHDAKFLYLAIRCQKQPGVAYVDDQRPRTHDADLSEQDHIRLRMDCDRDYATFFQLSVDHRGQTADVCWHDAAWNPRWYVAANQDNASWTIEAAIPWTELTRAPPVAGDAWALAIDRRVPTTPAQAWVGPPAEEAAPESFGLLIFE